MLSTRTSIAQVQTWIFKISFLASSCHSSRSCIICANINTSGTPGNPQVTPGVTFVSPVLAISSAPGQWTCSFGQLNQALKSNLFYLTLSTHKQVSKSQLVVWTPIIITGESDFAQHNLVVARKECLCK